MDTREGHKWERVVLPENLRKEFKEKYVCVHCKAEKLVFYYFNEPQFLYIRSKQFYDFEMECFGEIPLDEQTIDE